MSARSLSSRKRRREAYRAGVAAAAQETGASAFLGAASEELRARVAFESGFDPEALPGRSGTIPARAIEWLEGRCRDQQRVILENGCRLPLGGVGRVFGWILLLMLLGVEAIQFQQAAAQSGTMTEEVTQWIFAVGVGVVVVGSLLHEAGRALRQWQLRRGWGSLVLATLLLLIAGLLLGASIWARTSWGTESKEVLQKKQEATIDAPESAPASSSVQELSQQLIVLYSLVGLATWVLGTLIGYRHETYGWVEMVQPGGPIRIDLRLCIRAIREDTRRIERVRRLWRAWQDFESAFHHGKALGLAHVRPLLPAASFTDFQANHHHNKSIPEL